MTELRDPRPAPRVPAWLALLVLVAALVAAATLDESAASTAAAVVAVVAGWLAVAGMARRWTIGPWGAVAAGAAVAGILLLRDPGYRLPGVLLLVVGLVGLPILLAIARVKRYADRIPEPGRTTDGSELLGGGNVEPGSGPFD
ncbi:hypothetical protein EV138_1614 [Kribbella voronezhensis]|uniref:Uncharacterized protein n=1 Tax=Kribbella voronezhensis TaxID=2512212 RepID=A0A4R7T8D7_9ACTN|nr:hypothetical protein [Kribbella voronezhensis]TDU88075.1 hypothetical protein EV138_1614 [Kribbella voronezhensis]